MDVANFVGFLGSTISIVTFIPQVLKTWRTKSTEDLSLKTLLLLLLGCIVWLVYGVLVTSTPIILSNGIVGIFILIILYVKLKYK